MERGQLAVSGPQSRTIGAPRGLSAQLKEATGIHREVRAHSRLRRSAFHSRSLPQDSDPFLRPVCRRYYGRHARAHRGSGGQDHLRTAPARSGRPDPTRADFQNLIGNSLKYRHGASPEIHIWAERDGNYWGFRGRDNGSALIRSVPRESSGCSGVSTAMSIRGPVSVLLSASASCSKQHGGEIWAEGAPGSGAVFSFTLPDSAMREQQSA